MDRPQQFNPQDARIAQISTHASLPHKTLVLDEFQWICSHKNTNSHWKCMHATTPKPDWKSLNAKQKLARAACSEKIPTKRTGKQDASQILIQTQSKNLIMLHVLRRHQQNALANWQMLHAHLQRSLIAFNTTHQQQARTNFANGPLCTTHNNGTTKTDAKQTYME